MSVLIWQERIYLIVLFHTTCLLLILVQVTCLLLILVQVEGNFETILNSIGFDVKKFDFHHLERRSREAELIVVLTQHLKSSKLRINSLEAQLATAKRELEQKDEEEEQVCPRKKKLEEKEYEEEEKNLTDICVECEVEGNNHEMEGERDHPVNLVVKEEVELTNNTDVLVVVGNAIGVAGQVNDVVNFGVKGTNLPTKSSKRKRQNAV